MRYFAIHTVHHNPGRLVEFTGEYDAEGKAKVRAVIKILHANNIGEIGDDIVRELIDQGSVRELTEQEALLDGIATGTFVPVGEREHV